MYIYLNMCTYIYIYIHMYIHIYTLIVILLLLIITIVVEKCQQIYCLVVALWPFIIHSTINATNVMNTIIK